MKNFIITAMLILITLTACATDADLSPHEQITIAGMRLTSTYVAGLPTPTVATTATPDPDMVALQKQVAISNTLMTVKLTEMYVDGVAAQSTAIAAQQTATATAQVAHDEYIAALRAEEITRARSATVRNNVLTWVGGLLGFVVIGVVALIFWNRNYRKDKVAIMDATFFKGQNGRDYAHGAGGEIVDLSERYLVDRTLNLTGLNDHERAALLREYMRQMQQVQLAHIYGYGTRPGASKTHDVPLPVISPPAASDDVPALVSSTGSGQIHPYYQIDPYTLPEFPVLNDTTSRLVIGPSGSGKTRIVERDIHAKNIQDLTIFDPDNYRGKWPNHAEIIKNIPDFAEYVKHQVAEMDRRQSIRERDPHAEFPVMLSIADEYRLIVTQQKIKGEHWEAAKLINTIIWDIVTRGRKYSVRTWLINQANSVAEFGIQGSGALRDSATLISIPYKPVDKAEEQSLIRVVELNGSDDLYYVPRIDAPHAPAAVRSAHAAVRPPAPQRTPAHVPAHPERTQHIPPADILATFDVVNKLTPEQRKKIAYLRLYGRKKGVKPIGIAVGKAEGIVRAFCNAFDAYIVERDQIAASMMATAE